MSKKTDPVCKMEIEAEMAVGQSEYMGETYYFCSNRCKQQFDEKPAEYRNKV
jgi:YHS domain-containing protein